VSARCAECPVERYYIRAANPCFQLFDEDKRGLWGALLAIKRSLRKFAMLNHYRELFATGITHASARRRQRRDVGPNCPSEGTNMRIETIKEYRGARFRFPEVSGNPPYPFREICTFWK
jgi:hypothetical protein